MKSPTKLMRGVFLALTLTLAAPFGAAGGLGLGVGQAQAQQQETLISSVLFEGNKRFSDAQLLAMVDVAERGTFNEGRLAADAESIRLAYEAQGFNGVTVTPRTEVASNGRTRVTFVVDEGERTGIAAINFTGNNSIDAGTLKSVIRTRESHLLSWLFRDDNYTPQQLEIDKELIRLYYANHGFPDTFVTSAVAEYDAQRNGYFVNFTIVEGDRYEFGDVGIETSIAGLNADALKGTIETRSGDRYRYADLADTQEEMAIEATQQGYAFADVRPRVDRDIANRRLNVVYLVDEGPRVYVERINITGNTKTRDFVIRRELGFGEGDPFNRSMVTRGKKQIEALGFFKAVNIGIEPGSAQDKINLNVTVEEDSTGDYGISAGYSTTDGILGEVSITERNFLGRGQYVRAALSASQSGQSFDFSFTEPRFMGLRISTGVDVYHRIQNENASNYYGTTATGGQLRVGMPITRDLGIQFLVGGEQKTITNAVAPDSAFVSDGDVFNKAWVGYALNYNTLDDQKRPTEGLIASLSQQYVGIDHNYVRTEAKARYFIPIWEDAGVIGSVRGQAGILNALGGEVHQTEALYLGPTLVRGFEPRGFGPRTAAGELMGSLAYAGLSGEIEFPLPVLPESYGLRGAVWADAAWIDGYGSPSVTTPTPTSTDNPLKASVGASVIWDSPFGPLRGDVGYVVSKATDDRTQIFQLTLQNLL
jgi:outer membrane protein insertion porin family